MHPDFPVQQLCRLSQRRPRLFALDQPRAGTERLLVLKDLGNVITPYLATAFAETHMVDLRYLKIETLGEDGAPRPTSCSDGQRQHLVCPSFRDLVATRSLSEANTAMTEANKRDAAGDFRVR